MRFYTTSVAVGDLDQVRVALGYSAIDLYGSSYGTRMAELYMRRYPSATHAVILDGVTYPEQAIGPDTPLDGERALDLIVARCGSAPDCAAAYPNLTAELGELRGKFGPQKQPLVIADPTSGEPLEIEFNRSMFTAALRFLSYSAIGSLASADADPSGGDRARRAARRPDRHDGAASPRSAGERHAEQRDLQRGRALFSV